MNPINPKTENRLGFRFRVWGVGFGIEGLAVQGLGLAWPSLEVTSTLGYSLFLTTLK